MDLCGFSDMKQRVLLWPFAERRAHMRAIDRVLRSRRRVGMRANQDGSIHDGHALRAPPTPGSLADVLRGGREKGDFVAYIKSTTHSCLHLYCLTLCSNGSVKCRNRSSLLDLSEMLCGEAGAACQDFVSRAHPSLMSVAGTAASRTTWPSTITYLTPDSSLYSSNVTAVSRSHKQTFTSHILRGLVLPVLSN